MSRRSGLPVQVNGVGFETKPEQITWRTVPIGRQGVDQGAGPGETALSNELIWRRSMIDGIEGAGQDYADLEQEESSRMRFRSSIGIDPWTRRSFKLQRATHHKVSSANTNLKVLYANPGNLPYLFVLDGNTLRKTANPHNPSPTFTTITGGAGDFRDITTDGRRVWLATSSGVYYVDAEDSTLTQIAGVSGTDYIGYTKGRLIRSDQGVLIEQHPDGSWTDIFTHPSPDFVWRGFAESPGGIYAWGEAGDVSEVYVITAIEATGALDVPFHALSLPDGELVRALKFYVGVVILGTSKGLRLAVISGGGFLSIGPLIDEPGDVKCLEPQGEDVWFGWSAMDASRSGLGRARLSRFTAELVPAFATDLATDPADGVTGDVISVCTVADKRYFAVSGEGIWGEATTYVDEGEIDFGWFTFGIPEKKMADSLALFFQALPADTSISVAVYADDDTTGPVITGTYTTEGGVEANFKPGSPAAAERYRVVVTLATTDDTVTPTLRRITFRVVPRPFVHESITLPLIIADTVAGARGRDYGDDPYARWSELHELLTTRVPFELVVGDFTAQVRLDALQVINGGLGGGNGLEGWAQDDRWFNGDWEATFVTVEPEVTS